MSRKILIIGAGIAGLATARALDLRGMSYDIVEKAPYLLQTGAGMFLPGNAALALRALGLFNEINARAVCNERQTIRTAIGAVLHDMDVAAFWRNAGPCLSMTRTSLIDILASSIATPIRFGCSVASLAVGTGVADVRFSNGTETSYDLVIGADGLCSWTRDQLFDEATPVRHGRTCWRFVTTNSVDLRHWTVSLGKSRALLGVPLEENKLYVYADADDRLLPESQSPASDELRSLFADFRGPVAQSIARLTPDKRISKAPLGEIRAQAWHLQNAVLIGDAAHGCSPSMAQGASMALEDAIVMAECLSRSLDVRHALQTFSERRLNRVLWVQKQSRARDATRALPEFARDALLRLLGDRLYRRSYTPLLAPY